MRMCVCERRDKEYVYACACACVYMFECILLRSNAINKLQYNLSYILFMFIGRLPFTYTTLFESLAVC